MLGIETAMRHDVIMGGGPSDYAIVEAEADRVAQSALKALRESQEQVVPVFAPLLKRLAHTKHKCNYSLSSSYIYIHLI